MTRSGGGAGPDHTSPDRNEAPPLTLEPGPRRSRTPTCPGLNDTRPAPADSCARRATATPAHLPSSDHVSVMKSVFSPPERQTGPRGSGGFEVSGYSDWVM